MGDLPCLYRLASRLRLDQELVQIENVTKITKRHVWLHRKFREVGIERERVNCVHSQLEIIKMRSNAWYI